MRRRTGNQGLGDIRLFTSVSRCIVGNQGTYKAWEVHGSGMPYSRGPIAETIRKGWSIKVHCKIHPGYLGHPYTGDSMEEVVFYSRESDSVTLRPKTESFSLCGRRDVTKTVSTTSVPSVWVSVSIKCKYKKKVWPVSPKINLVENVFGVMLRIFYISLGLPTSFWIKIS